MPPPFLAPPTAMPNAIEIPPAPLRTRPRAAAPQRLRGWTDFATMAVTVLGLAFFIQVIAGPLVRLAATVAWTVAGPR